MADILVEDFVDFMDYVCDDGLSTNAPAHLQYYSKLMEKYSETDFIKRFRLKKLSGITLYRLWREI